MQTNDAAAYSGGVDAADALGIDDRVDADRHGHAERDDHLRRRAPTGEGDQPGRDHHHADDADRRERVAEQQRCRRYRRATRRHRVRSGTPARSRRRCTPWPATCNRERGSRPDIAAHTNPRAGIPPPTIKHDSGEQPGDEELTPQGDEPIADRLLDREVPRGMQHRGHERQDRLRSACGGRA